MAERNLTVVEEGAKTPPHDLRAEMAVLGGMLVSEVAVGVVTDLLSADDFYGETHRVVYRAMQSIYARREPVDQLTVLDELKRSSEDERVGGRRFMLSLVESLPTASNIKRYAELVREKSLLRDMIDAGSVIQQTAFEEPEDVKAALMDAEKQIYRISHKADGAGRGTLKGLDEISTKVLESIQSRHENDGGITGVASGFRDVDRMTGGWQDDDLIVLAARPAMGKTAFALKCVKNAAVNGVDVAVFSLEMSEEDLFERLLADSTKIELANLRRGIIEDHQWPRLVREAARMGSLPIWVNDDSAVSMPMLHSRLRRLQSRLEQKGRKLGMVLIDYLQLMVEDGRNGNRQEAVAKISRSLKVLARELKVPVIVISQLSRSVEMRGDKKPILSDLRESGAIEQDADLVMFLYREEYYEGEDTDDDMVGVGEVLIRKHRSGPTGETKLAWVEDYATFENLEKHRVEV